MSLHKFTLKDRAHATVVYQRNSIYCLRLPAPTQVCIIGLHAGAESKIAKEFAKKGWPPTSDGPWRGRSACRACSGGCLPASGVAGCISSRSRGTFRRNLACEYRSLRRTRRAASTYGQAGVDGLYPRILGTSPGPLANAAQKQMSSIRIRTAPLHATAAHVVVKLGQTCGLSKLR